MRKPPSKRKPTPTRSPKPGAGQRETGWKIWTHDRRSPIQGGEPAWDGAFPHDLPEVTLDTSDAECGDGWNYCREMADAFRIAGMWPTGRPPLITLVVPAPDVIHRGNKSRASTLRLVRLATEDEVRHGVVNFSQVFEPHADVMAEEQLAWRAALGRPRRDASAVESGLIAALAARGLKWKPVRHATTQDARAAWDAWDARAALTLSFAARQGWVKYDPALLTVGIRDAYASGLEVAVPTGPNELGWVMAEGRAAGERA